MSFFPTATPSLSTHLFQDIFLSSLPNAPSLRKPLYGDRVILITHHHPNAENSNSLNTPTCLTVRPPLHEGHGYVCNGTLYGFRERRMDWACGNKRASQTGSRHCTMTGKGQFMRYFRWSSRGGTAHSNAKKHRRSIHPPPPRPYFAS